MRAPAGEPSAGRVAEDVDDGSAAGLGLVRALLRVGDRVGDALAQALAPTGLTPAKFHFLAELASGPGEGLPLREMGRRLERSAPDVTELAARLHADGLIARARGERDRRVVLVTLTREGWRAFHDATPRAIAVERELRRLLGERERRSLALAVERLAPRSPSR